MLSKLAIYVSQNSNSCKSDGTILYPVQCDTKNVVSVPTTIQDSKNWYDTFVNLSNGSFTDGIAWISILDNIVYTLSLTIIIWTLWHFYYYFKQFRTLSLTKKALEYKNEFEGYKAYNTCLRVLKSGLLYLSFVMLYLLGSELVIAKLLLFVVFIIPVFFIKIIMDMTFFDYIHDPKHSLYSSFEPYAYKTFANQIKTFLKKFSKNIKSDTGVKIAKKS
jgi:hypothetical protein